MCADGRHRRPQPPRLSCTACLSITPQVTDPVFQFLAKRRSPCGRLAWALVLSVFIHGALIALYTYFGSSPRMGPGRAPLLAARLGAAPTSGAPRPAPVAQPAPAWAVAEPGPAPRADADPVPEARHEADVAPPTSILPAYYRPTSALSRGPELLTPPADGDWPLLPDAPPGRFQLELAIGADGTVHRVVPLCEEALCPAAEAYAELVGRWRFQPGDLNGEPMPSRLRLEFEIGLPADEPGEDQAPRQ